MGFTIATLALLLLFSAVPSNAQLNYEGNPLTENTEYMAEETHSVERNSRTSQLQNADTVLVNNVPQKLYPVYAKDAAQPEMRTLNINNSTYSIQQPIEVDPKQLQTRNFETQNLQDNAIYNTELLKTNYLQPQNYMSDYALNSFLHSKTPEESKVALEYYLKSTSNQDQVQSQPQVLNNELVQQSLPYQTPSADFQQNSLPYNQLGSFQQSSGLEISQQNPSVQPSYLSDNYQTGSSGNIQSSSGLNIQPTASPVYQPAGQSYQPVQYQSNLQPSLQNDFQSLQPNLQQSFQPNLQQNLQPNLQQNLQPNLQSNLQPNVQQPIQPNYQFEPKPVRNHMPLHQNYPSLGDPMPGMFQQPRVPLKYGPGRYPRFPARPRLRNKIPQQRIGPAVMYKSPGPMGPPNFPGSPVLSKPPKGVELIYTKPPGYRAPIRHSPPGPYEQDSSWYPEMGRLPAASQKDIYWSQLYQQSYDPHYYNYIAKTGKIKPHLYGKLGDRGEDEGILSDMIKGFKKHGLKNIMNPGFLLGMTIPALTLMLTALVQKRSLGRADFGPPSLDQQKLDEYMANLQKALRAHEEDSKKTTTKLRRRRR